MAAIGEIRGSLHYTPKAVGRDIYIYTLHTFQIFGICRVRAYLFPTLNLPIQAQQSGRVKIPDLEI